MQIPKNVIANADDLGLNASVNKAIVHCFKNGFINSASLLTNTAYFDEAVALIHENSSIVNIGLHVNLAEGRPITNFGLTSFLKDDGSWDVSKTNQKINFLSTSQKQAFLKEIFAQIDKALSQGIAITHLDSHFHIHTLPCFYKLFLGAAKHYKLPIRLAQTYSEGNYIKFVYRKHINSTFKTSGLNYSDYFETVQYFLEKNHIVGPDEITEVMLHPNFDQSGNLIDHYDETTVPDWIDFLNSP